jgi:hypothetical protein
VCKEKDASAREGARALLLTQRSFMVHILICAPSPVTVHLLSFYAPELFDARELCEHLSEQR